MLLDIPVEKQRYQYITMREQKQQSFSVSLIFCINNHACDIHKLGFVPLIKRNSKKTLETLPMSLRTSSYLPTSTYLYLLDQAYKLINKESQTFKLKFITLTFCLCKPKCYSIDKPILATMFKYALARQRLSLPVNEGAFSCWVVSDQKNSNLLSRCQ